MTRLLSTRLFLLTFLVSVFVFLLHTYLAEGAVFGDGRFYYATARSLALDQDIHFANEYSSMGIDYEVNDQGYVWNMYAPGASIIWSFAIWVSYGSLNLLNHIPYINFDIGGYGVFYQVISGFVSIFLGIFGLYLIYNLLTDYFSKKVSLVAVFFLYITTNLLFYIAVEPLNSHAVSFFFSAIFLYYFLKHKNSSYYFFVLGILAGAASLVRNQNAVLLLIPFLRIVFGKSHLLKDKLEEIFFIGVGFSVGILPQVIFWKIIFGTFWQTPYFEVGFNFFEPRILFVLFNRYNGFFSMTPSVIFALVGLFFFKDKKRTIALYSLLYFLIQLYIISAWKSDQGGSFSIRMMITTLPFLSFGYAVITRWLIKKFPVNKILLLILILGFTNGMFIISYLLRH